jgi:Ribose 5-phosphate isomerase A (phosphoriboisomerase A)
MFTEPQQCHLSTLLKRPSDLRHTPRLTGTFGQRTRYVTISAIRDSEEIVVGYRHRLWYDQLIPRGSLISHSQPGSTVPYVVERILQQGEERNKDRVFLPTGFQSQQLITHSGLRLGDITQYSQLDVTIDGADE